jgi:RNA polymerase sigma factor (sigma-70 family)
MLEREMGSLTLMASLRKDPNNQELWTRFVERYQKPVWSWASKHFEDKSLCDDVFSEFFIKVQSKIRDESIHPKNESYRSYFSTVIHNICRDYLKANQSPALPTDPDEETAGQRRRRLNAEERRRTAEEDFADRIELLDLEEEIASWRADEIASWKKRFRTALIQLKARQQYDPVTTEIFFKRYRDMISSNQLDQDYGYTTRDTSGQYARRVLRRLVTLMDLPTATKAEQKRSELIVTILARNYGDLSTMPE